MKVEFELSAGISFKVVEELEYEDDATDEYLAEEYTTWVFEQIGGWERKSED